MTAVPFPGRLPALVLLGAFLSAALVGYLVADKPDFLHLDATFDLRALAVLTLGLAISVFLLAYPGSGLELLAAFVYLNLSQVLVRHHRLPSLLQLVALPLLLGAWIRRDRADLRRLLAQPLAVLLVAYSLVLLFSTTLARDPAVADERLVENLKALAVCLLAALLALSLSVVRRGAWTLVASGAVLGGLAVVQVLTGNFRDEYGGLARIKYAHIYGDLFEPRIAGPLGDPNFFAQILVALVPLALFLAWEEQGALRKVLAFTSAALITAASVLTYSRGGALALACVLGLSLLARRVHLKQVLVGLGLVALLPLLLPAEFNSRLRTIEQVLPGGQEVLRPDSSFEQRKLYARVAWRIFLDHPLFGVGAGNYTLHFDEYAQQVGSVSREYEDLGQRYYPHNLYLEVAAETGLLGLAALGAAVAAALTGLRRARVRLLAAADTRSAALAKGIEIALMGYLVSSLFLHGHFSRYLWLFFGFAAALVHLAPSDGGVGPAARRSPR